jgi:flagellar assembly protein FliH
MEYKEQELLELIVKIARKVIDVEIALNPEIILHAIKNCLELLNEKEEIKVRVNINDWTIVQENLKKLSLNMDLPSNTEIIACEDILQGGCQIEFKGGSIDAEVDTKFAEIKRKILKNV